jgi:hypothetical protein
MVSMRDLPTGESIASVPAARRQPEAEPAWPDPGSGGDDIAAEVVADMVHEWGLQSFPASDPPANW